MAKQLVNPVERHIEKLIVAVAGLLLIGSIVKYGVTSPNGIELGGETVTPATINDRVASTATSIQERIRSARVEVDQLDPLFDDFEAELAPLEPVTLASVAPLRPETPIVDSPETPVGQKELVKAVVPDAPQLASGRSTFAVSSQSGLASLEILDWVTVTSLFNAKHQADVQKLAYGAQYGDIAVGPFDLQRRAQRSDGSWSEDDWEMVEPWPTAEVPAPPNIVLVQEGERFTVPADVSSNLDIFVERISRPEMQIDILRPLMPDVRNGTPWKFPILTTYEDVLRQDDYYLFPDDPPSQFPPDRYGLRAQPARAAAAQAKTIADRLKEIETMMKKARENCEEGLAIDAHNVAFDLARSDAASPSEKQRAAQLQARADQLQGDIRRDVMTGRCKVGAMAGGDGEKTKRVPPPVQQFWIHDANASSVKPGRTYEYRVRTRVLNQLSGDPTKFADPQDATRVWAVSDWSEPSSALTIPPSVEYFVISDDAKKEELSIEIYQWADGVWVKDRFRFGIGDRIKGESRQKVPSIDDPTVPDNAIVRFNGSAIVVAADFDRTFRDHGRGSSRQGFTIGKPENATVAVFVDDEGRLIERYVPLDKAHPGKRAAGQRVDTGARLWR